MRKKKEKKNKIQIQTVSREEKISLFHEKNQMIEDAENQYSNQEYKKITMEDYFRIVFGRDYDLSLNRDWSELELPFENKIGESVAFESDYVYNNIVFENKREEGYKNLNWIITKNLEQSDEIKGKSAITSPITYIGRNRTRNNARMCYGIVVDLDYVGPHNMIDLLFQINNKIMLAPNLIVNSGTGLHVYYLFSQPVPLYNECYKVLTKLKREYIDLVWNQFTSSEENKQFQPIIQNYRIPGTLTKFNEIVTGYCNIKTNLYSVEELNMGLKENHRLKDEDLITIKEALNHEYKSKKLEEAKELWPEWYQERIVEGKPRKYFQYSRNLYDWWYNKLTDGEEVKPGFRYFCALSLVSFATKCGVPFEEVQNDLYELVPSLDEKTIDEDNHFLKEDVDDALKLYGTEKAYKFRRETISNMTNIEIKKNKRNGRTREQSLIIARTMRNLKKQLDGKLIYNIKDNEKVIDNLAELLVKYKDKPVTIKHLSDELNIHRDTVKKWLPKAEMRARRLDTEFISGTFTRQGYNYFTEIRRFLILNNDKKWTKKELAEYLKISKNTLRKILNTEVNIDEILEEIKRFD